MLSPAHRHARGRARLLLLVVTVAAVAATAWVLAAGVSPRPRAPLSPAAAPARDRSAAPAGDTSPPTAALAASATATDVPAGETVVLPLVPTAAGEAGATEVRLDTGADLALATGGAYTLDHLLYDRFFLEPDGQGDDGSPRFAAVDFGATYLSADVAPRCPGAACGRAPFHVAYLVFTGKVGSAKEPEVVAEAQRNATLVALPTPSLAQVQAKGTALALRYAGIPSATPCPFPCPSANVTYVPAGAGFIERRDHALQLFQGCLAHVENRWDERAGDGTIVSVSAGGRMGLDCQYTGQGEVLVQLSTRAAYLIDWYETPTEHGPVRIVSAAGERLTLEAADGTAFVFDVAARAFLGPDGQPIPTATAASADTATPAGSDTPAASPADGTPQATAGAAASPSPVDTPAALDLSNPTVRAAIADGVPPPLLATPYPAPSDTAAPTAAQTDSVPTPLATAAAP